ncbi:MAG: class I SAM-dependent methyltransferase [Salinibacter sp.]
MTRQDQTVAAQYDIWARVYDVLWRRYTQKTVPVLQRAAAVRAGERVLDLACGTGTLAARLDGSVSDLQLVGVDLSASMIERARRKLGTRPGLRFERADTHDLPFDDASFDVVLCANTFHYFSHPGTVLSEARRVLCPGGRLVLLDWCRDFWTCRAMDAVLRRVDPAHHTCYTLDDLRGLLRRAGFDVRWTFRYRFDLIWGMMAVEARPRAQKR